MRLSDSKMGMVRGHVTGEGPLKSSHSRFIFSGSIIYYSNFFLELVIFSIKGASSSITNTVGHLSAKPFLSPNFGTLFSQIFSNNISLDLNLMVGGIFLSMSTLIKMISSNLIDAGLTSVFIQQAGLGGFFRSLFPQFVPETMGYVFGLGVALQMSSILISLVQAYAREEPTKDFKTATFLRLKMIMLFAMFSVVLLIIGALIEAAL